jgi:uncharacterized protein
MADVIYTDVDTTFYRHPGNHDVLKRYDVDAVKTALRNIFLTEKFEKPFDPDFGLGMLGLLFENYHVAYNIVLKKKAMEQITRYEPRAIIDDIQIQETPDTNSLSVNLFFYVIGNPTKQELNVTVERVR